MKGCESDCVIELLRTYIHMQLKLDNLIDKVTLIVISQ